MEATKTKPLDLLDKHQLSQIREKNDFRNIFALCLDWGLIVFGSPTHSWSKGMTVALRVEARQLPFQEQVYLTHVEVSFESCTDELKEKPIT